MMRRRWSQCLLFTSVILLTVQLLSPVSVEDWTTDRSRDPFHAHDPLPGGTEELTETEDGKDPAELEYAFVLGSPFHIALQARPWRTDHNTSLQDIFCSDRFRPPILSLV